MKNNLFKDDKGFSLIELIVAVLIMAIIAGGAIYAFSSVYSTEVKAGATKVCDALKQARTSALALENHNQDMSGYVATEVYAKFYSKDDVLYVDVCSKPFTGTETVYYTEKIGSGMKATFQKVKDDGSLDTWTADTSTSKNIYVYFKKSTGGISGVRKVDPGDDGKTSVKLIKLENTKTGLSKNLILVDLTGRCYVED